MNEPWQLGIAAAGRAIAGRALTSSALVRSLLERADHIDGDVKAWVRLARDSALREAARLDAEAAAGRLRGPLHGVPLAIKDIVYTAGIETNVGSTLLAGFVPAEDAPLVRRLREAGAIVLGKSAMTEFAAMDPAPTRNPWNLEHTPGGSSSGSAAAVAACLAPGAIGTQTAGSIIRPASYCGVVGLKPTYDAVERAGVFPCAWSMDHVGPMARSVEDVALLYATLAGDHKHPAGEIDMRIGVADRYFYERADHDTRRAFEETVKTLTAAGARLVQVKLPPSFEAGVDAGIVTMYAEMAAVHRQRFSTQRERYGWKLACLLDAGGEVSAVDYLRAQQVRRIAGAELSSVLSQIQCLMTPSTPAPAPKGLGATGDWTHNLPFSSSGHPALTVPVSLSGAGLPISVQLAARHGGEERLFHCGSMIERLVNFSHKARCR
ncbi:MAG: amidase [Betaproteobacteria bacterium]|nr:MAG: amidase [Betaproteobacteria bacterium]